MSSPTPSKHPSTWWSARTTGRSNARRRCPRSMSRTSSAGQWSPKTSRARQPSVSPQPRLLLPAWWCKHSMQAANMLQQLCTGEPVYEHPHCSPVLPCRICHSSVLHLWRGQDGPYLLQECHQQQAARLAGGKHLQATPLLHCFTASLLDRSSNTSTAASLLVKMLAAPGAYWSSVWCWCACAAADMQGSSTCLVLTARLLPPCRVL